MRNPRSKRLVSIQLISIAASFACGCDRGSAKGGSDASAAAPDLAPLALSDFPAQPILDDTGAGVPPDAASLFAHASTNAQSGGPCLVEPELGSLLPKNWLRPRIRFIPPPGQNLFEIRIHAAAESNDLVVYTTQKSWILPGDIWKALTTRAVGEEFTVDVRGAVFDGKALTLAPASGTTGSFTIAPAEAAGSIVYWTTSKGSGLKGFALGDENVRDVLTPAQAGTACVGCHGSTPDGAYVAVSASSAPANGDPTVIQLRSVDGNVAEPPFLTAAAKKLLSRIGQEAPAFSKSHWKDGDYVALTMLPVANGRFEIGWTDLQTTSMTQGQGWGIVKRAGDSNNPAGVVFRHDGTGLVYTSAPDVTSGVSTSTGDLYTVPWNDRAGGAARPIQGASDPGFNEFYPTLSSDDRWLAFSRGPLGQYSYDSAPSEVFVIPVAGAPKPLRLIANDPPACTGKMSPGVTNSWPKWAPEAQTIGSKTYYWVTFSSRRTEKGNPQLYVAGVIVDAVGESQTVTTTPALHLWNQPADENNHTPAWDSFQLPVQ